MNLGLRKQKEEKNNTSASDCAIQKLKYKSQINKNKKKRQLRNRICSSLRDNKFKNFMKKWNERKKSEFKSVIPPSLFKAISSNEYIDLNELKNLEIQESKQDYLKVQNALKFYMNQIRTLQNIGDILSQKIQQNFPDSICTMTSIQNSQHFPLNSLFQIISPTTSPSSTLHLHPPFIAQKPRA